MIGPVKIIATLVCIVHLVSVACAKEKTCAGHSDLPVVTMPASPPCDSCNETKAEVEELMAIQEKRTDAETKHALSDEERSPEQFLTGTGIEFDVEKMKACNSFFKARREDEKAAVSAVKTTYCRLRPYNSSFGSGLKPLGHENSYSYPSGHATYGSVIGLLLVEMLPEKQSELYHRINNYAHSRMIVGVHHRSDVEAGKLLGAAIDLKLFSKDEFKQEFEKAKNCVRAAVKLP